MSAFTAPLRSLVRASRTGPIRSSLAGKAAVRSFSLSRPAFNSSLKDAFYTTPSTLDTQGSVLGEPTAQTVEKWQAGLWERLEAEMQSKHEVSGCCSVLSADSDFLSQPKAVRVPLASTSSAQVRNPQHDRSPLIPRSRPIAVTCIQLRIAPHQHFVLP
jgi:hypothetical protein